MKNDISILIPVYNSEKYLENSINSIINQTHKEWKIIAINDGSTDNSAQILKKFKKKLGKKMILLNNKKNKGIAYSLNKGLSLIETKFFGRQDSDDISKNDRLEVLIEYLNKNPKYNFISSKMQSISDKRLIFPLNEFTKFPVFENFVRSLPFCNAPTVFRSSILKSNIKFNTSNKYRKRFEDYEFFFKCYQKGYLGFNISKVTYFVRQDLNYYKKINLVDRLREASIKLMIFKRFNLKLRMMYHVFIPILKILIPNILFKTFLKLRIFINS